MKVIEFSNLWQMYNIKFVRKGKVTWESIWALEDINISVDKGEVLGIIGQNGAGKSTLLKLIAGILTPDKGKVTVKGKISMLMELGAGFNPEFTGRENIILNAQLYGVPAERLDEKVEEIIAFSELGKFIDAPLKYYSQGMYARLAFSLAIHVDPDILLVDDILAVGDEEFQRKCIDRIFSLKNENKTIIVVTHNMQMVEKLCDRVLFLDQGRLVDIDACRKVVPRYLESLGEKEGIAVLHDEKIRVTFNNGKFFVSFNNVALTKKHGGYVSFLDAASQAWLTSFNFKWAVVEGKEKYMVAQGVSEDTDLKIGLRIDLDKDNLVVQAEIKGEGTNRAADLHLDLLLASFYSRYFTGESYYRMPSFASKLEWQSITQIKEADILGLSREGGNDIAHLIIEKDESDRFILFNTGYTDEGRVVSVYSDTQTLKFTMRLLADTSVFEEYLASYRQEYLEKLKIKQEAAFKESCLTAKDLQLLVDPYNKSVHLLYKNKEITAGSGLGVSLKQKEDLFTTANASKFTCAKEGDCLLVDIEWDQVHLAQRWRFRFKDDYLYWDIDHKKESSLSIQDLKTGFLLNPEYQRYFCGSQEDNFPQRFTTWQDMVLTEPFSELAGVLRAKDLPALALEKVPQARFMVQNGDFLARFRTLQLVFDDELANKDSFKINTRIMLVEEELSIVNYISLQAYKKREAFSKDYSLISEPAKLFIDPENKVFHIYYKHKEVTKAVGIDTSFRYREKYFNIFLASKFTCAKEGDCLLVDIEWDQVHLAQRWRFQFKDNYLHWQISQKKSSSFQIEDLKVGFILDPEYQRYFCGSQEDNFPQRFTTWQDMVLTEPFSEMAGVLRTRDLPALALQKAPQAQFTIQNSDFLARFRTLQLMFDDELANKDSFNTNTRIMLVEEDVLIPGYSNLQDHEKSRLVQGSFSINSGDLTLFVNSRSKGIHLYYKDRDLTEGLHLFSGLKVSSNEYEFSFAGEWGLKKNNDKELELVIYKKESKQEHIFTFQAKEHNTLFIKKEIFSREAVCFSDYFVALELNRSYKRWRTFYDRGEFLEKDFVGDTLPARLKESKASEVILEPESKKLPVLKISSFFNPSKRMLSLYKKKERSDQEKVCLQYGFSLFPDEQELAAGRHLLFEGSISIGSREFKQQRKERSSMELGDKDLRFIFEDGKGKLLFKGRQLTKDLGICSSLRINGIWHDSSQAVWRSQNSSKNKLILFGKWFFLPVYQRWVIELEEKKILWKIEAEVHGDIKVELEQINIMLINAYDAWHISNGLKDKFDNFYPNDYDILPYRHCYLKLDEPWIRVRGKDLPEISFESKPGSGAKALVGNTDSFYKARLIQYQNIRKSTPSTKYSFFEGSIVVG